MFVHKYNVNTDNVDLGLDYVKKAKELLELANSCISSAESLLDSDISVSFATVKAFMTEGLTNNKDIDDECVRYNIIAKERVEFIENVSAGLLNITTKYDSNILNLIFNENGEINYNNNNGEYLSEEEFNNILLLFAYSNNMELGEEDLNQIIESSTVLTEDDKNYLRNQLDKGNVRAAIQYIIIKNAESDLDAIKTTNQPRIDEILKELEKPERSRNYINNISDFAEAARLTRELLALENELQILRDEIRSQQMKINQYKLSNIEFEYDCYMKLVGTADFEETIVPYTLFALAREFYNNNDDIKYYEKNAYSLVEYMIKNDGGAFYNWLNSDECNVPNKEQLINYFNSIYNLDEKHAEIIIKKIINPHKDKKMTSIAYEALGLVNCNYNLTEEEKQIFAYLYITEGEAAAQKYIKDMEQIMNQRNGLERALEIFMSIVTSSDAGVGLAGSYWEGVKIGTDAWFARIGKILDKRGIITEEEYAMLYVNNLLSGLSYLSELNSNDLEELGIDENLKQKMQNKIKNGETITYLDILYEAGNISKEEYDSFIELTKNEDIKNFLERNSESGWFGLTHEEWLKKAFNAGVATGNMLPSIIISAATSGLLSHTAIGSMVLFKGKTVTEICSKLMGLTAMGLYSYSSTKSESIRNGREYGESVLYSLLIAAGEEITEYFIGGIPYVSRGVDWLKIKPGDAMGRRIFKTLLNWIAIDPLMEVTQEEIQDNIYDPLIEILNFGSTDYEFNIEQFIDTAITTYMSTFVLQGVSVIVPTSLTLLSKASNFIKLKINNKEYTLTYQDVLDCVDEETKELSQSKICQKILEKMGIKTSSNNNFKLAVYLLKKIPEFFLRGSSVFNSLLLFNRSTSEIDNKNISESLLQAFANGDFSDIESLEEMYPILQKIANYISETNIGNLSDKVFKALWRNGLLILDDWQNNYKNFPDVYENILNNNGFLDYNGEYYNYDEMLKAVIDGKIENTEEVVFALKILKYYELSRGDSIFEINEKTLNSLKNDLKNGIEYLEKLKKSFEEAETQKEKDFYAAEIKTYEDMIRRVKEAIAEAEEELEFKENYIKIYCNEIINKVIPYIKSKIEQNFSPEDCEAMIKLLETYVSNMITEEAMLSNPFDPFIKLGSILYSIKTASFNEYIRSFYNALDTIRVLADVMEEYSQMSDKSLNAILSLIRDKLMGVPTDSDHGELGNDYRTFYLARDNSFMSNTASPSEISEAMESLSKEFDTLMTIQDTDEYIKQVGILWYKFMLIHPYADGNGRTGRILLNLLLSQRGILLPALYTSSSEQDAFNESLDKYVLGDKNDYDGLGDAFLNYVKSLFEGNNNDSTIDEDVAARDDLNSSSDQYKKYNNYEDFCEKYSVQTQEWYNNLPNEVKQLFYRYTRGEISPSSFKVINAILRKTAFKDDKLTFIGTSGMEIVYDDVRIMNEFGISTDEFIEMSLSAAEQMMSEILKFQLDQPTTFYRGVNWDALAQFGIQENDSAADILQKLLKEPFYYDAGFMSSAPVLDHEITVGKPIIFELNCPEGTAFLDMSVINSKEREVLLPPGTAFHVENVIEKDGKIFISFTAIPSESSTSLDSAMEKVDGNDMQVDKGFELVDLLSDSSEFDSKIDSNSIKDLTYSIANDTKNNDVIYSMYEDKFYSDYLYDENKVKYATALISSMIINGNESNISNILYCLSETEQQQVIKLMEESGLNGIDIIKSIIL